MRRTLIAFSFLLASACASTATRPIVSVSQKSRVQPIPSASTQTDARQSTGVPVDFDITIDNPHDRSVTLTSVELETVGSSGGYALKRVRHAFTEVIPAKTHRTLSLRAWVMPLQANDRNQVEMPVMLRGIAKFDDAGTTVQTSFVDRLEQP